MAQHGRVGTPKAKKDIDDIDLLPDLNMWGILELDFDGDGRAEHREALTTLLSMRPDLEALNGATLAAKDRLVQGRRGLALTGLFQKDLLFRNVTPENE